jgi:uncharacterized protein
VPETALRLLLAVTLIVVAGKLASTEWNWTSSVIATAAQSTHR